MSKHEAPETTLASAAPWHTASYSVERGECVEVSEGPLTGIRDTQHRDLGTLLFAAPEWQGFLNSIAREFR